MFVICCCISGSSKYGNNLKSAFLAEANLRRANLLEANLEKADLREANLTKVLNLSMKKLSRVKTLHKALLDPELMERISNDYPHLLRSPGEEKVIRS